MDCSKCKCRYPSICRACKQGQTEEEKDIKAYDALCKYYSKLYGIKAI